jgi:hypothetical protein
LHLPQHLAQSSYLFVPPSYLSPVPGSELDLKKSGVQGRVIYDEAYKYPDKEDLGPLRGVVGGFAGQFKRGKGGKKEESWASGGARLAARGRVVQ